MKILSRLFFLVSVVPSLGLHINRSPLQEKPYITHEFSIERDAYSLVYDGMHKQARWVYEYLTSDTIEGAADRNRCDFVEDPLIPEILRSTKSDYSGSGYDRGHLCPAADARLSDSAMRETFFLSNISPQCPQFNRGSWARLEKHVRGLAKTYRTLHVFTGPLFLSKLEADGKRYVRYEVIGENEVAVPTHYFKIVLNEAHAPIEAYIMPNDPISNNQPLERFQTTVEKVERAAGFVFRKETIFDSDRF